MYLSSPFYLGKDFQGKKLKVSMARRKPMMGMMRGGMSMRGDRGGMMNRGGMFCQILFHTSGMDISKWFCICFTCSILGYLSGCENVLLFGNRRYLNGPST